ncbi:MBL fold metallo-hydrolase [Subsaximicrobium wynnwilliamsii]|uniref:MBL fold metallo-hydrolase n=1 Tax=Subsaximicrobium wynnwilliamsii TaxID=291179 RepID=A0A5C6ZGC5_9FLAO|nr:MBL fold metallo-hydrolase [Subsaximicrobium wynnwilliamsii]TXD82966.1 MBL fold metallo-hydrolase [Subsaximicrobium wynnwilliamsii]TXD88687.1 MBL fold metallo-hydrolase [Subsaximicrobium wynnwilliamsii]TXE02780.1 MBL fold metallo-hydrolase [Subsaximicrobium wynnwilliamsii]
MKTNTLLLMFFLALLSACKTEKKEVGEKDMNTNTPEMQKSENASQKELKISPIEHATMVLTYGDDQIFVDPTKGVEAFKKFSAPQIVLITDIHADHFDLETLKALNLKNTTIVAPKAVADLFPKDFRYGKLIILDNGETQNIMGYDIEAIPMYNLREEALKFHPKGRGNGYVINFGSKRIYISGDTEDISEMRNLKDIQVAFVCMNLPYTMTVESAVSAVLEFKPDKVYPYHYRGTDGLSDIEKFKTMVNKGDESIEVVALDWYN